uniref:Uncharacterized protein n=1 Tax=Manihot esculenta TaxID=3983 RepID=A0A2C9U388_MANES
MEFTYFCKIFLSLIILHQDATPFVNYLSKKLRCASSYFKSLFRFSSKSFIKIVICCLMFSYR